MYSGESFELERTIQIQTDGTISYLDSAELRFIEESASVSLVSKRRASQVHPTNGRLRFAFYALRLLFGENGRVGDWTRVWQCSWTIDLALSGGPVIGPFDQRSKAIEAEEAWLTRN